MKIAIAILVTFVVLKFVQQKGWLGKDFDLARDAAFLGAAGI